MAISSQRGLLTVQLVLTLSIFMTTSVFTINIINKMQTDSLKKYTLKTLGETK